MPSIGSSFFILGLVVASVTAAEVPALNGSSTDSTEQVNNNTISGSDNMTISVQPSNATDISGTTSMPITSTKGSTMDITWTTRPFPPKSGNGSSNDNQTTTSKATPKPLTTTTTKTTITTTTRSATTYFPREISPTQPLKEAGDSTGIIILVVIIIVALAFAVACYVSRKRGRRYSVDFTSRQDEANIPLSTVEPVEAAPQNGLQTFESSETATKEPQGEEKEEAKPEEQAEQKAEADKSVVDPSAESAAPAPSPESAEDKPKEDVVEPGPPPAPVEPSVEEKTDDEGAVSSKTSVESLKETNENNSNNVDFSQQRDLKSSNLFWDVPLNCPV